MTMKHYGTITEQPKMKLHIWDELANEVTAPTPRELEDINAERKGEWEYQGLLANGVAVLRNDRHYALETWAENEDEARFKFALFPTYREINEND
jgi:hypothetical protein